MLLPAQSTRAQDLAASQGTGCSVHGVVLSSNKPVAGAHVVLETEGSGDRNQATLPAKVEVVTDAAGDFVFSGLKAGLYRVFAESAKQRSRAVNINVSPASGPQQVHLILNDANRRSTGSDVGRSGHLPMQFADKPNFTVAGITDWTAVGGHGSDAILRTSETLARETLTLKDGEPSPGHRVTMSEVDLRRALAQAPGSFKANHELGEFLLDEQRYGEAIPLLEKAHSIAPNNFENACDLARAYLNAGEIKAARSLVAQLLAHQQRAELHRLSGEIDERAGNSLEAVKEYQEAVRLDPSEENYFAWGSELLYHRAIWQALEVFRKGVEAYPRSSRMLTAMGSAQFAGARYDEAAMSLCKASDLDPASATAYSFMGKVELASPDPLPCVPSRLARFLREKPDSALANYLNAMAILKSDLPASGPHTVDEAQALLQNAVRLDPAYGEAYLQLGILAYSEHKLDAAIAYYKRAIAARPQLADAYYRLGVAYGRQGKDEEARREFKIHDELEKKQAAAVDARRREIKQFQIVQDGMPALPAKP